MTTIPLGPALLTGSSDLPEGLGRAVRCGTPTCVDITARLPIWPCSVRGFACHPSHDRRGALLPHLFTLTLRLVLSTLARAEGLAQGGMFSVPLSFELPRPGVTRRTALRSSDFPPFDSPLRGSLRATPMTWRSVSRVVSELRSGESND